MERNGVLVHNVHLDTYMYFGHLNCMFVVYVTYYKLQRDTSDLNQSLSVMKKLLHFVELGSSCRKPIS